MNKILKVNIPSNINLFYNCKSNLLLISFKNNFKLLKLEFKLLINKKTALVLLTTFFSKKISNNYKKKSNNFRGLLLSFLKQNIFELLTTYYQKLKFVGVGYRAINYNLSNNKSIFLLKLGISHPLYLNTNSDTKISSLKHTKLFIFGNSYKKISQVAANIRLKKKPEPYKGKGILYNTEKIKLKKGKKI